MEFPARMELVSRNPFKLMAVVGCAAIFLFIGAVSVIAYAAKWVIN